MLELATLKGDCALLLSELGLKAAGQHLPCPFHGGSDSLRVSRGPDGAWLWQCMAGCGGGTIIDAVMKNRSLDRRGAILALEQDLGLQLDQSKRAAVEPVIDMARAEKLIELGQKTLRERFDIQEEYMHGKRGLPLATCEKYRVGFIERQTFREWPWWPLTAWVLPITNRDGKLIAIKLHNEIRATPKTPKSLWAPFGTVPLADPSKGIKPKHGWPTLWPPPESFGRVEEMYLLAGELKALAVVGIGRAATGVTSGESWNTGDCTRIDAAITTVVYDADPAGEKWRDKMLEALAKCRKKARAITLKRGHAITAETKPPEQSARVSAAEASAVESHAPVTADWIIEDGRATRGNLSPADAAAIAAFDARDAEARDAKRP